MGIEQPPDSFIPSHDKPRRTVRVRLSQARRMIRLGLKSLWLHRLRSLLTILGIVFGVCSVIAMLAVGEGASHAAQQQIKSLGSQNIILKSVKPPEDQAATAMTARSIDYGLTHADIAEIKAAIPSVRIVVPARVIRDYVWNTSLRVDCEITGTVPWHPETRNQEVVSGRFFTETEYIARENVCVLEADTAQLLFPIDSPLGKTVRVQSQYYRIIGVMAPLARPESATEGKSGGPGVRRLYIPLTTAQSRFGETTVRRRTGSFEAEKVQLHEATVQVANPDEVVGVAQVVQQILLRNHQSKDYELIVPLELLKQAERTKQIFNIVLGSIAAISLLVGGIGIMNIMLASVTERTREIGIRRALGARRRDIITQFLVETVLLSGTGGLLGVILGVLIPFVITWAAKMVTIITLWSPLAAFGISALIGVAFGLYPAFRAAQMDPVEALRHE